MIAIVAAYAHHRVIGKDGKIPWDLPNEKHRFRDLTTGQAVVMGRRTYAEIGRPLPDRLNIILSRNPDFYAPGCLRARSLAEAVSLAEAEGLDLYVSGGSRVYQEALPLAVKLFITEIDCQIEGDTFFPPFDETLYTREIVRRCADSIPYAFLTYTKKDPSLNLI